MIASHNYHTILSTAKFKIDNLRNIYRRLCVRHLSNLPSTTMPTTCCPQEP